MKEGDVCIFQIPLDKAVYTVRCECWKDYEGELSYGCAYYRDNKEILHAGHSSKIDTYDKAVKAIQDTIELFKMLSERGKDK